MPMKTVIQRVRSASVTADGVLTGKIGCGYMLLSAFRDDDDENTVKQMAGKIVRLRVFEDAAGKMNLSLEQVGGQILSISQFTLYADCRKGNRPSFDRAGRPDHASRMYDLLNEELRQLGVQVETGVFGADMKVELVNDGPVTIIFDSDEMIRKR